MKKLILSPEFHQVEMYILYVIAGLCIAALIGYFIYGAQTAQAIFVTAMSTLFVQSALNLTRYRLKSPAERTGNLHIGDIAIAHFSPAAIAVLLLPTPSNLYIGGAVATTGIIITMWKTNFLRKPRVQPPSKT